MEQPHRAKCGKTRDYPIPEGVAEALYAVRKSQDSVVKPGVLPATASDGARQTQVCVMFVTCLRGTDCLFQQHPLATMSSCPALLKSIKPWLAAVCLTGEENTGVAGSRVLPRSMTRSLSSMSDVLRPLQTGVCAIWLSPIAHLLEARRQTHTRLATTRFTVDFFGRHRLSHWNMMEVLLANHNSGTLPLASYVYWDICWRVRG